MGRRRRPAPIRVTTRRRSSRLGALLRAQGFARGSLRGSTTWLAVGVAGWLIGRLVGKERTATVELQPGESLLITHEERP